MLKCISFSKTSLGLWDCETSVVWTTMDVLIRYNNRRKAKIYIQRNII